MIWVSRRRVQRWDQGSWRRRGDRPAPEASLHSGKGITILLVQGETKKKDRKSSGITLPVRN